MVNKEWIYLLVGGVIIFGWQLNDQNNKIKKLQELNTHNESRMNYVEKNLFKAKDKIKSLCLLSENNCREKSEEIISDINNALVDVHAEYKDLLDARKK